MRIVIADGFAMVRAGLRLIIESRADTQVVGEAADSETAWALTQELQPDVVLMDFALPDGGAVQVTQRIHAAYPQVKVLAVLSERDDIYGRDVLTSGATSYVFKHSASRELMQALDRAMDVPASENAAAWDVSQRGASPHSCAPGWSENEERFRQSFDFAPIGMALVSLEGESRRVNQALCEILGYSTDQLLAAPWRSFLHPEDAKVALAQQRQLLAGEARFYQAERRYRHRLGHLVWAQVSVSLVRDGQGQPLYLICQFQDISDRKRFEVELSQARDAALESVRVKANFMANMSHEIRTPMNGIIGMLDLLRATALSSQQREFVSAMHESADALLVIINDILDFSKIEAGKMPLERAEFDLSAAIESAAGLLAPKAHERGLSFATLIYRDVPVALRGDAARLRQVLLNLFSNALKFTPRGEVTLRVTREGETESQVTLCFAVRDSGIGIGAAQLDSLFEPFAQADASTTRRYGGTGLGLAISKQLIELMGGRIGVRSKQGKGSTFWFTLPFEKPEGTGWQSKESGDWRVLVVEERGAGRDLLQEQLASWNCRSDACEDESQALDRLHEQFRAGDPYHVVMLSQRLGDRDSLSLVRSIRQPSPVAATRIVVITPLQSDPRPFLEAGCDDHLVGPVRQSQLFDVLVRVMDDKRGAPAPHASAPQIEATEETATVARALRVLVAEDNPINQKVVRHQLRDLGHDAVLCDNGCAAIEAWQTQSFDLILMDCHMPDLDGYATTRAIRAQETVGQRIPILALTANALSGDREKCLAAGMDDHLSKPLKQSDLQAALARWAPPPVSLSSSAPPRDVPQNVVQSAPLLQVLQGVPVLQQERWNEMQSEFDPELLRELVELFGREVPLLLDGLRSALRERNAHEVQERAHKLKGSCSTMGAARLAALGHALESCAQSADWNGADSLQARLSAEFAAAQTELQRGIRS